MKEMPYKGILSYLNFGKAIFIEYFQLLKQINMLTAINWECHIILHFSN